MTIKQVEEQLNIPKATIRFYEKEGLIRPERRANGYRDYSPEDVEILRRVVIFRKLGMPVEMIAELQDHAMPLQQALEENISQLERQMEELQGAITVCRELQTQQVELEAFDNEVWWQRIHTEEQRGGRFMDLAKDLARFYGELAETELGLRNADEEKPVAWKQIALITGIILTVYCVIVVGLFKGSVMEALQTVVSVTIIEAAIALPRYFLRKKSETAEQRYNRVVFLLAALIVVAALLLVAVLMLNGRLHFWF